MLSYPYLLAVARAVLAQSAAIQGRCYMAPFWASELNTENLQQIVADSLSGSQKKQYPLSLILPPISDSEPPNSPGSGSWEAYTVNQLFLKQEGRTSDGQIQDIDWLVNNSQHTITEDWHDMRRAALGYYRVFRELCIREMGGTIRPTDRIPVRCVPVTRLGNDRLNGVLLSYRISIFDFCGEPEDYPPGYLDAIVVPAGDQHPAHPL